MGIETSLYNHQNSFYAVNSSNIIYSPKSFLEYLLTEKKRSKDQDSNSDTEWCKEASDSLELLPTSNIEDYYLQTRFCDMQRVTVERSNASLSHYKLCECLMNNDTIISFRSGFFQFGITALIIAQAMEKDSDLARSIKKEFSSNSSILQDPFALGEGGDETDRLYFVLDCKETKCKPGKLYLILCDWDLMKRINLRIQGSRNTEYKIVEGHIEKESVQIMNISESLFRKFETFPDY